MRGAGVSRWGWGAVFGVLLGLSVLGGLLAGCTGAAGSSLAAPATAAPSLAAPPTLAATALPTLPLPTETATAPAPLPVSLPNPTYRLAVDFDYDRHFLVIDEQIVYPNRTGETLQEMLLVVEPATYPGVFQLKQLTWENQQPVEGLAWDGNQVRFPLAQPLAPGETLILSLVYELNLPSPEPSPTTRPVPFGYTARQTNLVDWYPFVPPYQTGQGWLANQPYYYGEHLVSEMADFEVVVRLAAPREDLIFVASAPEQVDGDTRRYRHTTARSFAWSVSREYVISEQQVGDINVRSYAFGIHAAAGEAAGQAAAEALRLYQELFGPYPHAQLAVVEADFLDGMEYDGLFFLSNAFYNLYTGTPGEYLVAIAVHETAHQWWYALVGNDQANEPWLDEALATYAERLYYEKVQPAALEWWWNYRVKFYSPQGWIDATIYNSSSSLTPWRSYRDAVYLNGAMFLEDLRSLVGDDAFFAFLKDYTTRHREKIATGDDFFAVLAEHTDEDFAPLVSQYFEHR